METNKYFRRDPAGLRRRAEEKFREMQAANPYFGRRDEGVPPRFLDEIQVTQIEVELQNEELRRIQTDLDAARTRYFDLYDQAPVGYLIVGKDGVILEGNLTAARLTGASRGAFVGKPLAELIVPEDWEGYQQHRRQLFETGAPQSCEIRLVKKDGSSFWAGMDAVLAQDDDGAPVCRLAISDLTARKEAEALRLRTGELELAHRETERARRRLEAVLQALPVGVAIVDAGGAIVQANDAFEKVWGGPLPPTASIADYTVFRAWWADTDRPVQPEEWAAARCVTTREIVDNQFLVIERFDGSRAFIVSSAAPVYAEPGDIVGCAVAMRDITARRRAEDQLRELNATLEARVRERTAVSERRTNQLRALTAELVLAEERERQRLAQLLHDHIQQLLVAAKMSASAAHRQATEPSLKTENARVLELLEQAIAASRSLAMELSPPALRDEGLLAGVKWLAKWMQETHGLAVEVVAPDPDAPLPQELRRIGFNAVRELLFNVVKHAGVKSARVTIAADPLGNLHIVVADDGKGFDAALPATGAVCCSFGLFNIRERLAFLDGHLDIDSAPGRGTRISLTLPIRHDAEPSEKTPVARGLLRFLAPGKPVFPAAKRRIAQLSRIFMI
jgi:PAS domain S-box-containing protein